MARKATVKQVQRRHRSGARPRPNDRALQIALTQELYNIIGDAVVALGVARPLQRKGLKASLRGKTRRRPSQAVLRYESGIALLLDTWRRDTRYRFPDGTTKVLKIMGKGPTLQSLVQFCVPELEVAEVVEILLTYSDVTRLDGDKVALLSHPVKITEKTVNTTLAYLIWQIRHLSETIVYNAKIKGKNKGRYERQIYGSLPLKKFLAWAQAMREKLQDSAEDFEVDLDSEAKALGSGNHKVCGIGLYLFREDGNLG